MTSSSGPIRSASSARCRAAVAEFTATAWRVPTKARTASSNAIVRSPVVSQPESSTSRTAVRSAAVIEGRWKGIGATPEAGRTTLPRDRAGGVPGRLEKDPGGRQQLTDELVIGRFGGGRQGRHQGRE